MDWSQRAHYSEVLQFIYSLPPPEQVRPSTDPPLVPNQHVKYKYTPWAVTAIIRAIPAIPCLLLSPTAPTQVAVGGEEEEEEEEEEEGED